MNIKGGCYCERIRYAFDGDIATSLQCHCRECQYITGGNPNVLVLGSDNELTFLQGEEFISSFTREDLEAGVTRLFCSICGTALGTKPSRLKGSIALKIGTMDDPSFFAPSAAIFTKDKQSFHHISSDIPAFEEMPG